MADEKIADFTAITDSTPERAAQYLRICDDDLGRAVTLYFESGGADLGASIEDAVQPRVSAPARQTAAPSEREIVNIESDDDDDIVQQSTSSRSQPAAGTSTTAPHSVEDDEAMARRLQEEMYGDSGGGDGLEAQEGAGIRAPIGRTAETLMGPDSMDWRSEPDPMNAAIAEQLLSRTVGRGPGGRRPAGIFNQQMPAHSSSSSSPSVWDDEPDSEARRRGLARATGGESEKSLKNNRLAEMFRPPFELISALPTWDLIRQEGKEREKWILVNVQDPEVFDSHSLNRDIWRDQQIKETVKENFIFKQYSKTEQAASEYIRYYFPTWQSSDAYPHIAIIDPRTGEQVKVWSGSPTPKAADFLMQLHEFLDRYSLKSNSRNPVARRKPEKKKELDVDKMTEEEMLEMALQNSLQGGSGPRQDDPDTLTRSETAVAKGKQRVFEEEEGEEQQPLAAETAQFDESASQNGQPSAWAAISSTNVHVEPAANTPNTTRIQFRHPGGRVIRRFGVDELVRRLYEWMKSEPLDGKVGVPFELIYMGKNLIDSVDLTIEAAGLKNGSVMVEFVED